MDRTFGTTGSRFLLWVDAVGGYWVCLGDEVVLGQPAPSAKVDVPILGDLSGCHARIRRDREGYLLEAIRDVKIDGRRVQQAALLNDGAKVRLGEAVWLLFRRPMALSATARLDFLSRHRTHPSSDAVLLMAEACVLGPKPHSHVVCRDWTREAVLYRRGGELYCRAPGKFAVDGVACDGCGRITMRSRVEGEGFSFNLEPIPL